MAKKQDRKAREWLQQNAPDHVLQYCDRSTGSANAEKITTADSLAKPILDMAFDGEASLENQRRAEMAIEATVNEFFRKASRWGFVAASGATNGRYHPALLETGRRAIWMGLQWANLVPGVDTVPVERRLVDTIIAIIRSGRTKEHCLAQGLSMTSKCPSYDYAM